MSKDINLDNILKKLFDGVKLTNEEIQILIGSSKLDIINSFFDIRDIGDTSLEERAIFSRNHEILKMLFSGLEVIIEGEIVKYDDRPPKRILSLNLEDAINRLYTFKRLENKHLRALYVCNKRELVESTSRALSSKLFNIGDGFFRLNMAIMTALAYGQVVEIGNEIYSPSGSIDSPSSPRFV